MTSREDDPLYDVARKVTDEVMGAGTYAEINGGNPDPGVQAAIARAESDAWTQPLDGDNVADLIDSLSATPSGWVGIVSEEAGGIIAYVHQDNLDLLRDALCVIPPAKS